MMNTFSWSNDLGQAIGSTLIHSLWQGIFIAGIVLAFVTRMRSSERRYWSYCAGMAFLLASLVVTFAIQMQERAALRRPHAGLPMIVSVERQVRIDASLGDDAAALQNRVNWNRVPEVVAWVWLTGVVAMCLRAGAAAWNVRSLRKSATPWHGKEWQEKLAAWLDDLGIKKIVRLGITKINDAPAVIGHFKPIILLPAAIVTRLSPEQVETLILHELWHIQRNDFLVNALQVACETLLFFHPAAWWLSCAIRLEREYCCDEGVARQVGKPVEYARALFSLEDLRVHSPELLAVGAGGGSLKKRISRLLSPPTAPVGSSGWALSLCSIVLLMGFVFWCWPKAEAQTSAEQPFFQVRIVARDGEAGEELPRANAQPGFTQRLRVTKSIVLESGDVKSTEVMKDAVTGSPQISITLKEEGAARFGKATEENVGGQAAIIVNGIIISAPVIRDPILGGKLIISGAFDPQEAADLARKLAPKDKGVPESNEDNHKSTIEFRSYFFEVSDEPSRQFTLQTRIDSGSDDVSAWSLTSTAARDLIASAKQTRGVDLLASPVITTLSGRAARIDVGKLPNRAFEPGGKATDTKNGNAPDQGPVYSANATGYVINKEPASQSQPALIGQSLELLPELSRDRLIVAGSFLDRRGSGQNKNPVVETRYSAPIYVKVPKDGAFALGQRSKAKGAPGEKYLLLLIVPKTED